MGSEDAHEGVIDLVEMQAVLFKGDTEALPLVLPIPDAYLGEAQGRREQLVEALAEVDDQMLISYVEHHEVSPVELKKALRRATIANLVAPVVCGSALKNKGVQPLLDAVLDYLPSPLEVPPG
jgi:elongation factor G